MPNAILNRNSFDINDCNDSIVIVNALGDIPGGRTLDTSAWGEDTIKSGHIIIKTADGAFAPLGVTGSAYKALAESEAYVGVLRYSVTKADPRASIVTIGQIREAACPFAITAEIKAGLKDIQFI